MMKRSWRITLLLLKMINELEVSIKQLEKQGVTILALENVRDELVLVMVEVNGISRRDAKLDWLVSPIFDMTEDRLSVDLCLKELQKRFYELRQESARRNLSVASQIG